MQKHIIMKKEAAWKNTTTNKDNSTEPSTEVEAKRDIAIRAIQIDEIFGNNAAAAKEKTGKEMSSAAAKKTIERDKEIQQEK